MMNNIILFIRDKVVGLPYVILVIVSLFLIFAIIGYLGSLKYNKISSKDDT